MDDRIWVDRFRKSSISAELSGQKEKKEAGWGGGELTEEITEVNNKKFVTILSYFERYHH